MRVGRHGAGVRDGTKGYRALAIAACSGRMGVDVSAGGTMLVFAAVILATMVPVAPGNLGTYEASAFSRIVISASRRSRR